MEWQAAELKEENTFKIPARWLHLYYYEALNILFRFENALRIFVYIILKRQFGRDWDLASIGENATIRTETKKRLNQAREHGYLGYEISSPMLFLNSGELIQLVLSDSYWKYFAPYFKASKSIVLTKLQEIGTVRNSLAHFRPIKKDDIDLIKQNSRHLLLAIEDCLVQITSIIDVVPTNSEEEWYKDLKPIGNENLTSSLFSSRDQAWVRLSLTYRLPTLHRTASAKYPNFRVATVRTAQILKLNPKLKDACIYLSESDVHFHMGTDGKLNGSKAISIVFAKATLQSNLAEISEAVKNISLTIENETELIKQDNLARGALIEGKGISAAQRETSTGNPHWTFSAQALITPIAEIDEVEYWGTRWHYATDFISSTAHYPWMPSSVSTDDDMPF